MKPILIRDYCLGPLEHGDLKASCTNKILDCFGFFGLFGFCCCCLFFPPEESIVGLWGPLEDAGVGLAIVLVIKSDAGVAVGPSTAGPTHKCHCPHLKSTQNCGA